MDAPVNCLARLQLEGPPTLPRTFFLFLRKALRACYPSSGRAVLLSLIGSNAGSAGSRCDWSCGSTPWCLVFDEQE